MKKAYLYLVVMAGIFAATAPVRASEAQIAFAPVPSWAIPATNTPAPASATGLLFFEHQNFQVHLDAQGQSVFQSYRVKLLHPQALQLGNILLKWKPTSGSATMHTLAVHRGGVVTDVLGKTKFDTVRSEDQLEQAMLSGLVTATLQVPDLRVGDVLEVAFTLRDADPTFRGTVAGLWGLAEVPVPGNYRMALTWEEGQAPRTLVSTALQPSVTRASNRLELAMANPAALPAPKDAPPRYGWQRMVEYSDFADWSALANILTPLYRAAANLKPGSSLKSEAARIAAKYPNDMERAAAALRLVQQDVRYVYVGLGEGNMVPVDADTSWERRFADCKGKTAMLLALLGEMGIPAEAVLVNNAGADDGLDKRLPNPAYFDHVLVRATIAGKPRWLDGTLPPVARPSLRPILPYRWVLPLRPQAELLHLPFEPAREPQKITLYEIDSRKGFDDPAKITTTTITRGIDGLGEYAQFSALTADQITTAFKTNALGGTFDSIDSVEWRYDDDNDASVLTISGKGTVDWDDDGDGKKSLSLPGGGFSPPERRQRDSGQDQGAPYYSQPEYVCHVTTVRLPSATKDQEWAFNRWFWNTMYGRLYYRGLQRHEGTIRMVRGSLVGLDEIPSDVAARDNARLAAFDNSMANIFYVPGRDNVIDPAKSPNIPATWEIDWARPNPPCIPTQDTMDKGRVTVD